MIVYKITNKSNGKVFIGFSKLSLYLARGEYLCQAKMRRGKQSSPIRNAINKYGDNNFTWETLIECETRAEAYKERERYVKLYNSTDRDRGYNTQSGGFHYTTTADYNQKLRETQLDWHKHNQVTAETKKRMRIAWEQRKKNAKQN